MKKLFLSFFVFVFAICGAYAGNSEQIAKLVETIKNAPAGSITATNIPVFDDCRHVRVSKDGNPFLYERACFSVGLRLKGLDPVENANYTFTIYDEKGESEISGGYEEFKELISVIPEPQKNKQDIEKNIRPVKDKGYFGFETLEEPREHISENKPVHVEKNLGCGDDKVDVSLYQDYAMVRVGGKDIKLDKKEIKSVINVEYSNADNRLNVSTERMLDDPVPGQYFVPDDTTLLKFRFDKSYCGGRVIDKKTEQKLETIFKKTIPVIPEPKTPLEPKDNFEMSCDNYAYGFYVTSATDENITVEYYNGSNESQEHVLPKIFDEDGVKVYFGGNDEIFVNNNGKWKNYGHRCTEKMKYKTVTQQCGTSGKIKVIWYEEWRDPFIVVDLAAGADPWGFSDVALVYKLKCDGDKCEQTDKIPSVFLREGQGISFKNDDMIIKYDEDDDGHIKWKIDNKLCEFGVPKKEYSLQDKINDWKKMDGFNLVCAGGYLDEIDGISDIDIYKVAQPKGSRGGFPIAYAVHDDKIIREFNGPESMEVLRKVAFRPCGRKIETGSNK